MSLYKVYILRVTTNHVYDCSSLFLTGRQNATGYCHQTKIQKNCSNAGKIWMKHRLFACKWIVLIWCTAVMWNGLHSDVYMEKMPSEDKHLRDTDLHFLFSFWRYYKVLDYYFTVLGVEWCTGSIEKDWLYSSGLKCLVLPMFCVCDISRLTILFFFFFFTMVEIYVKCSKKWLNHIFAHVPGIRF